MKIKYLIVLIVFTTFYSCSNRIDNKELEQSFQESINFSKFDNELIMAKFDKALYDIGQQRVEKYSIKAKRVRKIAEDYNKNVYKFYYDSISHKNIEELINEYDKIIDTIKSNLPISRWDKFTEDRNNEMLKKIIRRDFKMMKKDVSDKLIALQIINNVIQNETILDRELLNEATDFGFWFTITEVKPQKTTTTKENEYKVELATNSFAQMATLSLGEILIDSIVYNGKLIKKNFRSEVNYSFANICFDNLQQGNYYLVGKVQTLNQGKDKHDYPFRYRFEIEK